MVEQPLRLSLNASPRNMRYWPACRVMGCKFLDNKGNGYTSDAVRSSVVYELSVNEAAEATRCLQRVQVLRLYGRQARMLKSRWRCHALWTLSQHATSYIVGGLTKSNASP